MQAMCVLDEASGEFKDLHSFPAMPYKEQSPSPGLLQTLLITSGNSSRYGP